MPTQNTIQLALAAVLGAGFILSLRGLHKQLRRIADNLETVAYFVERWRP
jgi:hypothetical protein